ncbi:MAG: hypothetical protein KFH87_02810 [Bacteroidetes bacterium]|nr:hypothetical protein [Bacteroidota bacterium]
MKFRACLFSFFLLLLSSASAQVLWQSDIGPWGGTVYDVCEAPAGQLLAATAQGLFRSDNQGESWTQIAFHEQPLLSVHVSAGGAMLVDREGKLLRSADHGQRWEEVAVFPPEDDLVAGREAVSAFFGHSSGTLFFSKGRKTYISSDDGWNWELLADRILFLTVEVWSEALDGTLLAGRHYYTLPDMEATQFDVIDDGTERASVACMLATGGGHRVAATGSGRWFRSTDAGVSWRIAFDTGREERPLRVSAARNGHVLAVYPDARCFYSTDHGATWRAATWRAATLPAGVRTVHDLLCTGGGGMFIATDQPGLLRLDVTDGSSETVVDHMVQAPVSVITRTEGKGLLAALPLLQEMRSYSPPGHWHTVARFDFPISDILSLPGGTGFVATRGGGGLYRSSDSGGQWERVSDIEGACTAITQLRDGRLLLVTSGGLLVSRDGGNEWLQLPQPGDGDVHCVFERSDGSMLLGTDEGVFFATSELAVLRRVRPSWLAVTSLGEDANGRIYAGTPGDGLYLSDDDGFSWKQIGFEGETVTGIVPAGAQYCFIATREAGVHESRDAGMTWKAYGNGLRSMEILTLLAGVDGYLYAGSVAGMARSKYRVLAPFYQTPDFSLLPGSPNPAIDNINFAWSIPRQGSVRMTVHDMLGREVAVVFEGDRLAGMHWQQIDTTPLAQGSYVLSLYFEGSVTDRVFQVLR